MFTSPINKVKGISFGTTTILSNEGTDTRYLLIIETEAGPHMKFFFDKGINVDEEVIRLAGNCINDFTDLMEIGNVSEV